MENENSEDLCNEIRNIIDHSDLQNHLKIQLEELEVLQAMYYNLKEFIVDHSIMKNVAQYVNKISHNIPPLIEFSINLKLNDVSLEFQVVLPRTYPTTEPEIIVRSNQLNRHQQNNLNDDLKLFIENLDRDAICIYECISWVTDNLSKYYVKTEGSSVGQEERKDTIFSRFWIYSHHIYSKEKRKDIVSLARQHHITGFCLSGKPGIICTEGLDTDCEEWWQKIKSMTWKKIICKKKEEFELTDDSGEALRKFQNFSEISFISQKNNSRESHTDMGEFYRYLLDHDCAHVFKDYFGIEGKVANSSDC